MNIQSKLVLTGGRAGTSCVLSKIEFKNGEGWISGDQVYVHNMSIYMGRVFKAFPEGSDELAYYQKEDAARIAAEEKAAKEASDGKRVVSATAKPGKAAPVPSPVQPGGAGAPEVPTIDGAGAAPNPAGGAGSIPSGGGHSNTGVHGTPADQERIVAAVTALDPMNDEHWTADGRPRIDAVEVAIGRPVTREEIAAAVPDFRR